MPLSLVDLQKKLTKEQVRLILTDLLTDLGFPVTAWQQDGAARTLLEGQSALGAQFSEYVAQVSKMGFLGTSAGEYLEALAESHFDTNRNAPTTSLFDVGMLNAGQTVYAPGPGEILIQSSNGQIFANTSLVVLSAETLTTIEFRAQIPGAAGNVGPQNMALVTPLAGVTATFDGQLTSAGSDEERDPQLRERCQTKWGLLAVEKPNTGVLSIARAAAPSIHSVSVDDDNPRGAGTVDVFCAAENATSGAGDVALVQGALDGSFMGQGVVEKRVQAFPAPTTAIALTVTVYVKGATESETLVRLSDAWDVFLLTVPVGGFDLSPGPQNILQVGQINDAFAAVPNTISISVVLPATDTVFPVNAKIIRGATSFSVVVLPS